MADRIVTIQQSARSLRLQATANVSDSSGPTLEEDMEDISIAIWGGEPIEQVREHMACET